MNEWRTDSIKTNFKRTVHLEIKICFLINTGLLIDWNYGLQIMVMEYLWIIVIFLISCLDSHSDGTHSLQSIHWWTSDVMLNFSITVLMKKQPHLHLGWPKGKFSANFHFWVNYSYSFKPKILSLIIHPLVIPNPSFIFKQIKVFLMKSRSFLILHRQQCNYHVQGSERE